MSAAFARFNWLLAAILALGLGLRLWGINYGLPYTYAPDEPTYFNLALQIVKTGDLNPHWWYYPSLMFYVHALAISLYALVRGIAVADLPPPEVITMGVGKLALPSEFLLGRGVTVLFSVGTIVLAYLIGRRIHPNQWVAPVAALFAAVSPTVLDSSQRIGPDVLALFFALVSFYFTSRITDEPDLRNYLLAGIGAGLATATKYNVALIVAPLLVAHLVRYGWRGWQFLRRKEIYLAVLAAVLAFIVATPFAVLDLQNFWWGVRFQAFSYSTEGHAGQEGDALRWYLGYLWGAEGWIFVVAGIAAAILIFAARRASMRRYLILVTYPLVYFIVVSLMLVRNPRTILQIIPFIDLLAALGLVIACEWLVRVRWVDRRVAVGLGVLVGVGLALAPVQSSIAADRLATRTDDRETARLWIDQNLPPHSRVAVEAYAPYVDTTRFTVEGVYSLLDHTPEWYEQNGFEYLVSSYGAYGRYYEDSARYSESVTSYESLFQRFPEVARFDALGYPIRVLKTTPTELPEYRSTAKFGIYGPVLELVGYDWDSPNLTLYWRTLESRREALQLTVRLLDSSERELAVTSGNLFGNIPSGTRPPQQIVRVPWELGAPAGAAPGLYHLELDVDAEGIGRLPVLSASRQPVSDKLFLSPFKIPPAPPTAFELQSAQQAAVNFGDSITLLGYRVQQEDVLGITLYWSSLAEIKRDYTVFVHLVDSQGNLIAQRDAQPLAGLYPTSLWGAREIIPDDYTIALVRDLKAGDYKLEIGLYEYPSLVRLTATDAKGKVLGDHLTIAEIHLP